MSRADFTPKETAAPGSVQWQEVTPTEYRAIRYSIARQCRGNDAEMAGFIADHETEQWLKSTSTQSLPLAA